jgi:hypothetical protein
MTEQILSAAQTEELKLSAVNFGFDAQWITEITAKFGGDVLSLVVEAVRGGFSIQLVIDVITKFGPAVLEFLVNLLNNRKMNVAGTEMSAVDFSAIIDLIVQKYLPVILDKYGPQITKVLTSLILDFIKNVVTTNPGPDPLVIQTN